MPTFTARDYKVFKIDGFAERMAALKGQVRPKLEGLGKSLPPVLEKEIGEPVYAHVAKHMRRTVNAPVETWVAFCMDHRAYKKHPHLAVVVGEGGVEARLVVKDEHPDRAEVGRRLKANKALAVKALGKDGRNGDKLEAGAKGEALADAGAFIDEAAARLQKTKTATLSLALPLDPKGDMNKEAAAAFKRLTPLLIALSR